MQCKRLVKQIVEDKDEGGFYIKVKQYINNKEELAEIE